MPVLGVFWGVSGDNRPIWQLLGVLFFKNSPIVPCWNKLWKNGMVENAEQRGFTNAK